MQKQYMWSFAKSPVKTFFPQVQCQLPRHLHYSVVNSLKRHKTRVNIMK